MCVGARQVMTHLCRRCRPACWLCLLCRHLTAQSITEPSASARHPSDHHLHPQPASTRSVKARCFSSRCSSSAPSGPPAQTTCAKFRASVASPPTWAPICRPRQVRSFFTGEVCARGPLPEVTSRICSACGRDQGRG